MNKKLSLTFFLMFSTLVFVGAGCGKGQVAIPANEVNNETALKVPSVDLQKAPVIEQDAQAVNQAKSEEKPKAPEKAVRPSKPTSFPGVLSTKEIHKKKISIATERGEIVFELFDEEAPKTVSNFVALARSGYYDGLTFHRVVPGFVIQGGDPLGNGLGGPGYTFEDENVRLDYKAGIVAMANAGPNTNGSQFFIVLEDQPTLPKAYTIFGRVLSGMDAVRGIRVGDHMQSVVIEEK